MLAVPLAIRLGAPLSVRDILVRNLLPVTIGNIIGGGVFVATFHGLAYGNWEKTVTSTGHSILHHVLPKHWLAVVLPDSVTSSNSSSSDGLSSKDAEYAAQLPSGKQQSAGV